MIFAMEGQKSRQPCGTKTQVKTALDLQTKKREENDPADGRRND
jgi:hypothetical protein